LIINKKGFTSTRSKNSTNAAFVCNLVPSEFQSSNQSRSFLILNLKSLKAATGLFQSLNFLFHDVKHFKILEICIPLFSTPMKLVSIEPNVARISAAALIPSDTSFGGLTF
jgi:hypothetical protein